MSTTIATWQDDTIKPLRRIVRPLAPRGACFVEEEGADLNSLLWWATRMMFLCGERKPRAWWMEPADLGWRVTNYTSDPRRARYRIGNRAVDVFESASWFGDEHDGDVCRTAWDGLNTLLASHFDPHAHLMGTPARTGLDLLERSLPQTRDGTNYEYPVLAPELRSLCHREGGQGHFEYVADVAYNRRPGPPAPLEHWHWLDARWMYAACVRHLPVGPWTLDEQPDYAGPYQWGLYDVSWRVPEGWELAGLLPVRSDGAADEEGDAPSATWPRSGTHRAWVGAAQLAVALDEGWRVTIHRRLLAAPQSQAGSDPARAWVERLVSMREAVERGAARGSRPAALASAAIRSMLLGAVGSWYRDTQWQTHAVALEEGASIPAAVAHTARKEGEHLIYEAPAPIARDQQPLMRPEWAVATWDRARARLMRAYLRYTRECPTGHVYWLRSDALVVDTVPGWSDNGKPGQFRLKRTARLDGPMPTDESEYRAFLATLRTGEGE